MVSIGETGRQSGMPSDAERNLGPSRLIAEVNHDGKPAFIPRLTLLYQKNSAFTFIFARCQFPVRFAFSMSIGKSQR